MKPMPEKCTEAHLRFLDEVRESGKVNMFGSGPVLNEMYPELSKKEVKAIVIYWMETFSERHNLGE